MSVPMHELASRKSLRLAYCFHCKTISKVEVYDGPPAYDVHLQRWIDEHLHGMSLDDHPGGQLFVKDESQFDHAGAAGEAFEEQVIEAVRSELVKANMEVYALRDSVKEDALRCHSKHGRPSWPAKGCPDYKDSSKRIGRADVPDKFQQWTCQYCPYEETVRVQKRWNAGQYK